MDELVVKPEPEPTSRCRSRSQ